MRTLLWFAAAAATLAVAGLIVERALRNQAPRLRRALAAGPFEVSGVTVIEIVPLDVSGPLITDTATIMLLDELVNESLFLK
jgi:hypothetical protein